MTQDYQHSVRINTGDSGDVIRAEIYEQAKAIWNERSMFDLQYEAEMEQATRAQTRAKLLMKVFPKEQLKWLKQNKAAYRISATCREKRLLGVDLSVQIFEPEAELVEIGYDIDVWFEDVAKALLFKLTFGGNV